jgi:hypothetical protein
MLENDAKKPERDHTLWFTFPLASLIAAVSLAGLLRPELYSKETADWVAQATAQDAVDLFLILPVFVLSGLYLFRGERLAEPIWGGALVYLIYTFIIYCFAVHFNALFLAYVAILSISAYGLIYFMRRQVRRPGIQVLSSGRPSTVIGIYFQLVAVLFFLLWLADIIPAILQSTTPPSLVTAGLVTNPVHVLDLAIFLPGVFIVGLLLRRQHPLGLLLAPVLLVFFVLMDITIAVIFVAQQSIGAPVNIPGMVLMSLMALLSLTGLAWFLKSTEM